MSAPILRLFVNERRKATAVKIQDDKLLQVYPKKHLFASQGVWQEIWEKRSKPILRVTTTNKVLRFYKNGKRLSTAFPYRDEYLIQAYPMRQRFADEASWRQWWETTAKPRIRITENSRTLPPFQMPASPEPSTPTPTDWTHRETTKCVLPPGKYYIGDLCYALSESLYQDVFGGLGGFDSGLYKKNNSTDCFMVDQTAFGDGLYFGSDNKEFAVDAGILGICPVSMMLRDGDGGHVYEFSEPVRCLFLNGRFYFRSGTTELLIDTCD